MTTTAMITVGLIGLFSGGIINYIACLLTSTDDPLSNYRPPKDCLHQMSFWEAIPLLSFYCQTRECKYCQKRLFLAYPLVEMITASAFLLLAWHFGLNANAIGLMIFVGVLIAVCITDFKVKIIPHEITYPAIILGIIFSAQIRHDLPGSLAGIGISYIVFDFLAFYGLQVYLWMNKPTSISSDQLVSTAAISPQTNNRTFWFSSVFSPKQKTSKPSQPSSGLFCKGVPLEELEVIGGGDAVLSALISAWLGWHKLILALIVSFLVGAILGAIYMLAEFWKQRLMKMLILPVTLSIIAIDVFAKFLLHVFSQILQQPSLDNMYLSILPWVSLVGVLIGVMIAGSRVSKPFPFGPALAAGAVAAIFT